MVLHHFLSAARRVILSACSESDNHGAGGIGQACQEVREQRVSREKDKVERRVSVAESGNMSEKESGEGRAERTDETREEGESIFRDV